jgi:hypothetical protein
VPVHFRDKYYDCLLCVGRRSVMQQIRRLCYREFCLEG